jgi:hypothetical protein
MTSDNSMTIKLEGFSARVSHAADHLVLSLTGNADSDAVPGLERFMPIFHARVLELGFSRVVVDWYELEFMTSACMRPFVTWLCQVRELEAPRAYRVRFVSNPNRHWQRPSLSALSMLARDRIDIEHAPASAG